MGSTAFAQRNMRLKFSRCITRMSDKITTPNNRDNYTGLYSFQREDDFEAKVKRGGSTKRQSDLQHKSLRLKNELIWVQSRGTSDGSVERGGYTWRMMILLLLYSGVEPCVLFYCSVALPLRLLSHLTLTVVIPRLYLLPFFPSIPQTKGSSIYLKDAESIERVFLIPKSISCNDQLELRVMSWLKLRRV